MLEPVAVPSESARLLRGAFQHDVAAVSEFLGSRTGAQGAVDECPRPSRRGVQRDDAHVGAHSEMAPVPDEGAAFQRGADLPRHDRRHRGGAAALDHGDVIVFKAASGKMVADEVVERGANEIQQRSLGLAAAVAGDVQQPFEMDDEQRVRYPCRRSA